MLPPRRWIRRSLQAARLGLKSYEDLILRMSYNGAYANGTGSSALFYDPQAVAADSAGRLYVADTDNQAIRLGTAPPGPPPPMQIGHVADQVVLSWPSSALAFVLEGTQIGSGRNTWTALTNGVVLLGENFVLTNQMATNASLYRLRER